MEIYFGPAGLGPVKTALTVLEEYSKLGLKACEIAFTYGPYIKKKEEAEAIGRKAKELNIELSIHAQYWINLNSAEPKKIEDSKKRILECCNVGEWLNAKVVVFHPGYYSKKGKENDFEGSFQTIKEGIMNIQKEIKEKNWKIRLAPEIMGKVNVFGSAEEISRLVRETGCSFCIDFAHLLAREKKLDFEKIKKLFPQKEWHVHFSGIVYNEKGERHHRHTEKEEWLNLLKNIPSDKMVHIINESPTMVQDSREGLRLLDRLLK